MSNAKQSPQIMEYIQMSLRAKRSNLVKEMLLFTLRLPRCARNDTEVRGLPRFFQSLAMTYNPGNYL